MKFLNYEIETLNFRTLVVHITEDTAKKLVDCGFLVKETDKPVSRDFIELMSKVKDENVNFFKS